MVLTLTYDETGCSGTFACRHPPDPLRWAIGLIGVGLVVALGLLQLVAWAGTGLSCIVVCGGVLLALHSEAVTALFDVLAAASGARRVAHFRVSGGWLTVVRGERTDHLFLPRCRLDLQRARLDVCSQLTGDRVVIEAGADEGAVQELAAVLEQMQRLQLGQSTDVPAELQQLTATVETPEA